MRTTLARSETPTVPSRPETEAVTSILEAWRTGDPEAGERLMPLVYTELRRLAGHYMGLERADHTLQPTALVHEAYLRLLAQRSLDWQSRAHFVAVAATMMRRVLLNHARALQAGKRGSGERAISFAEIGELGTRSPEEVLALEEALTALAELEPRLGRVVELRLFGGFTVAEAARYLGSSPATVKRDWRLARAWLQRRLAPNGRATAR